MTTREPTLPVLGITMGDPAGIGPEIIVKAAVAEGVLGQVRIVVIGDPATLRRAVETVGVSLDVVAVSHPTGAWSGR